MATNLGFHLRRGLAHLSPVGQSFRQAFAALAETSRLADALAEVIELRPSDAPGALDLDLRDLRRMDWKDPFDTFPLDNAADGEHCAHSVAAPADHDAAEHL